MAGGMAGGLAGGNAGGFAGGGAGFPNGLNLQELMRQQGLPQEFPGVMQQSGASSRSVSISENGRTVAITESSDAGITVTVTETIDGEERKTEVKAPNKEELRKKNAEAYRLYQRYMKDPAEMHEMIRRMMEGIDG